MRLWQTVTSLTMISYVAPQAVVYKPPYQHTTFINKSRGVSYLEQNVRISTNWRWSAASRTSCKLPSLMTIVPVYEYSISARRPMAVTPLSSTCVSQPTAHYSVHPRVQWKTVLPQVAKWNKLGSIQSRDLTRSYKSSKNHHHNHFTALFPGPPGWAGARRELLHLMVKGKINRGRQTDHPAGHQSIWTKQCALPSSPGRKQTH